MQTYKIANEPEILKRVHVRLVESEDELSRYNELIESHHYLGNAHMAGQNLRYPKVPIVAHRRKFRPWLVTMEAETFFRLLRGDFLTTESAESTEATANFKSGISDFKGLCGPENCERKQQTKGKQSV